MSQIRSIRNNSGFTLVELMMAMLIAVIGMFGVLETINVTLQHNLKNELRSEAIKVGERYMTELRGKRFDRLSTAYSSFAATSKVRGGSKSYTVERTTAPLAYDDLGEPTSKQLQVVVKWAYKNISSQNRVVSVVARP